MLISKDVVFNEGIIGLSTLPWKQVLKFDNTTIPFALYNLEASHGDQGSNNVNMKSTIHNDDPIVDKPSLHGNERPANDQSHHSKHEVVQHPKEIVQPTKGFMR